MAWSEAHAQIRFLSPLESYEQADMALAAAMVAPNAFDATAPVGAYADALPEVCAAPELGAWLGDTDLYMIGDVLVIKPGYGDPVVPNIANAVAIDLRDLPAVPGLDSMLERAVAPAIYTDIPRLPVRVKRHLGLTDELHEVTPAFANEVVEIERPPMEATGPRDLPLVVITDDSLAPAAARFAIDIRMAERGWIVGEDIPTRLAEARFGAIGDAGLFWRMQELVVPDGCDNERCQPVPSVERRLPDVMRADERLAKPHMFFPTMLKRGLPTAYDVAGEVATRPALEVEEPYANAYAKIADLGTARASLLVTHGALRLFYPYFDVVGDDLDGRLRETLETVDGLNAYDDRPMWHTLRRLGEALHDGQVYVATVHSSPGILPARFDHVDGMPVVTRSLTEQLQPGDTVTAFNGTPIKLLYEKERLRTSAATPGHQDVLISEHLRWLTGPVTLTVRDTMQVTRTETIAPWPSSSFAELPLASTRESGWLADMDAPEVYYLNLDRAVTPDDKQAQAAIEAGLEARAMIVDLRGALAVTPYAVAGRLTTNVVRTPRYGVPTWVDGQRDVTWTQRSLPVAADAFEGELVLLVGPNTQGNIEQLAMMLTSTARMTVVGRTSAGTTGTPSGVKLPAGARFGFTGVEVQWPETGTFHGIGIMPSIEVQPTATAIHDGVDQALEAAVEAIGPPMM